MSDKLDNIQEKIAEMLCKIAGELWSEEWNQKVWGRIVRGAIWTNMLYSLSDKNLMYTIAGAMEEDYDDIYAQKEDAYHYTLDNIENATWHKCAECFLEEWNNDGK